MKLAIKSNYNILLWHFIDYISQWDKKCPSHLKNWYEINIGFSKTDLEHLKKYATIRTQLGLENEAVLFNWAFNGFQKDSNFSKLSPHIFYFEDRKLNLGITLKTVLLKRNEEINLLIKNFDNLNNSNFYNLIKKISIAINTYQNNFKKVLPVYIVASMDGNTSGGANGWGIFSEIPPKEKLHQNWRLDEILYHECFHKLLNPRFYFLKIDDRYKNIYEEIFNGAYAYFADEVLTYACTNVYLKNQNIEEKIKSYYLRKSDSLEYLNIWLAVKHVYPLIEAYIINKSISPKKFISNFTNQLFIFIKKYSTIIKKLG